MLRLHSWSRRRWGLPVHVTDRVTVRQVGLVLLCAGVFGLVGPTVAAAAPGAFSKISPVNGATGVSTRPTVHWQASAGATSYEVCANLTATCAGSWVSVGNVTTVTWPGPALDPGTTYYWQVRALDALGFTAADSATWWHFATQVAAPGAFNKTTPVDAATGQATSPTLIWGASLRAASYEYCVDTTNDSACSTSWTSVGTSTSVGLSGLAEGTTYYWQVRAVNAGGTTMADSGTWWSFATLVTPPLAFGKISPTNGATDQSTSPTVTWQASAGATSYEVCANLTATCAGSWVSVGNVTSVTWPGPALDPGTTYYWQVRAVNAGGYTPANGTTWWHFTTHAPPGAFGKATPANGAPAQGTTVTLAWESSARAASYEYCIDTSNDSACSTGWTSVGTSTSVGVSALAAGTTYYWQVRAVNVSGTTEANGGTWWHFTTYIDSPGAFGKASPVDGATGLGSSVTLAWTSSAMAMRYEYCVDTTDDSACGASWTSVGTATSVAVSGLAAGSRYFWQVRAVNAGGTTYADGGRWWTIGGLRVSAGHYHTCGMHPDGTVACWGNGTSGQTTPPAGTFTQVSAGGGHTCGVHPDGTAACWGWNGLGEATPPGGTFTQVSAGSAHTCAVRTDGTVACWGDNIEGEASPPAGTFTQVSAGVGHTCGVHPDGTVACWGNGASGQTTPPAGTFTQVSAGSGYTCGMHPDGTVACWGAGASGQTTPPGGTFTQVSAGRDHTCGVHPDGTVACWGDNTYGQTTPPGGTFTQVSAGLFHTCGVRTDETVACWGYNIFGQAPVISVAPSVLPAGAVGVAYAATLTASGGFATPYVFAVVDGTLPPGLVLAAGGALAGTPAQPGTWPFTVRAVDANFVAGYRAYTLAIGVPPPTRIIGLSGNLAFGNVTVNTTATRALTISNTGNSALTVSSISYPAGFSGAWSGSIPAGFSQLVLVTFAPTAVTSYGGTVTVSADQTSGTNTIAASGTGVVGRVDLDGDHKADPLVFRPSTGEWWGLLSTNGFNWQAEYVHATWGAAGDVPVPGDYDGDGIADLVVFRPSTGEWWGLMSSHNYDWHAGFLYATWGQAGDVPVPGDYDGDGKADLVVFRPSTGDWWGLLSSHDYDWHLGYLHAMWGVAGDVLVPGDYDGDGLNDLVVFRPSTGDWWGLLSSNGYQWQAGYLHAMWGAAGDVPVPGDYDGDGMNDLVVFRPSTGDWWGVYSSHSYAWQPGYLHAMWGAAGDVPVPGDYDGDGKADLVVFRPTTGDWWGVYSSQSYAWQSGYLHVMWGAAGDVPVK